VFDSDLVTAYDKNILRYMPRSVFFPTSLISVIAALGLSLVAKAANFSFQPPVSYLGIRFAEYGGGPQQFYSASKFSEIQRLFESDSLKIIWTVAEPPTTATPTVVGGLFVLVPSKNGWIISDARRFESSGKYSGAAAVLTSFGSVDPHVTITLHQGGRGASWEEAASYVIEAGKIKPQIPAEKN
jgi:hypothetical protein